MVPSEYTRSLLLFAMQKSILLDTDILSLPLHETSPLMNNLQENTALVSH